MNRLAPILVSICLGSLAASAHAQTDYTQLPIAPSQMHAMITGRALTLTEAIAIAEEHVGGTAGKAQCNQVGQEHASGFTIIVYTETEKHIVVVDGIRKGIISDSTLPDLPGLPAIGELVTLPSGLMYYDLVVGEGPTPPTPTSQVEVHYSGWLNDRTKFDSSYDRGKPITFPLNQVIRGWTQGVGSMHVGGIRKLIIPGDLAYGPQGRPPLIPQNAVLIFDVELVSIPSLSAPPAEEPQDEATSDDDDPSEQD